MSSFTINVPVEQFTPTTQSRVQVVRTGCYCDVCREDYSPADGYPPYAHKHTDGIWHIPAKGGGFYLVSKTDRGVWHCDCAGFSYRHRCQHLYGKDEHVGIIELDRAGKRHDLSHRQVLRYETRRWPSDSTVTQI